eukprot:6180833-Pleurochrysis_carterae.AAC.2
MSILQVRLSACVPHQTVYKSDTQEAATGKARGAKIAHASAAALNENLDNQCRADEAFDASSWLENVCALCSNLCPKWLDLEFSMHVQIVKQRKCHRSQSRTKYARAYLPANEDDCGDECSVSRTNERIYLPETVHKHQLCPGLRRNACLLTFIPQEQGSSWST